MFKKAVFSLLSLQFLTAFFHLLSFFNTPHGTNDTERQLIDLMTNYKQDMGMGIFRSTFDIFTGLSTCFVLLCIFGGWINLFLLKNNTSAHLWKGLLRIQSIVFGGLCISMTFFTFLFPIVFTGLITLAAVTAFYFSDKIIHSTI